MEKNIIDDLSKKFSVVEQSKIKEKLLTEIQKWKKETAKTLNLNNPFYQNMLALKSAKQELVQGNTFISSIEQDLSDFKKLEKITKIDINDKFWNAELEKLKNMENKLSSKSNESKLKIVNKKNDIQTKLEEDGKTCRTLLQEQWQKSLDKEYMRWELESIEKYRRELLEKLEEWLKLVQQVDDLFSKLSIDTGVLFDLSKGNISLSDIEQLKKWVEYISKDDGVKQLCDLLGRLRRAEKTSRQELVKTVKHIKEFIPDINSKEEIVGVHLDREIEYALPHELALLADEETSILFDMKYIEGRLMCFDMEGIGENHFEIENEELIETEEEKLGPIIICVDTSSSMSGSPETIAKAVTLYVATRAIAQKRNCLLINFSTRIETLNMSGTMGLEKVIEFLKKSFYGGTDVEPALTYALNMMKENEYHKSDLLVISDFMMSSLPNQLAEKIYTAKKEKNKFYSLAIGNLFLEQRLKNIFDEEWVYNPDNSSIHSIKSMVDTMQNI